MDRYWKRLISLFAKKGGKKRIHCETFFGILDEIPNSICVEYDNPLHVRKKSGPIRIYNAARRKKRIDEWRKCSEVKNLVKQRFFCTVTSSPTEDVYLLEISLSVEDKVLEPITFRWIIKKEANI